MSQTPFISHTKTMKELHVHLKNVSKKMLVYDLNVRRHLQAYIGEVHDFGKYSPFVQEKLRNRIDRHKLSNHALISAFAVYGLVLEKGHSKKDAFLSFLCVYFHHMDLKDIKLLQDDKQVLEKIIATMTTSPEAQREIQKSPLCYESLLLLQQNFPKYWMSLRMQLMKPQLTKEEFVDFLILFSMLTESDKEDASEYQFVNKTPMLTSDDVSKFICNKFHKKKNASDMDILRNTVFHEVSNHYEAVKNRLNRSYNLTLPTGLGKTILGLFIALKMCEDFNLDKIVYGVPLTGVVDQSYNVYESIIKSSDKYDDTAICKHHHLAEIKGIDEHTSDEELMANLFRVEGWDANFVCTTLVQILGTLFGTKNSMLRKLVNMRNSLIIIDESQGINPKFVSFLNEFLQIMADKLNIYFLVMTATKTYFLEGVELAGEKYFQLDFLKRTKIKISKRPMNLAEFINHIDVKTNALVTVNEIPRCKTVYKALKKKFPHIPVFCLNTEVKPYIRNRILSIVKEKLEYGEPVILVTTQIVEAGMDIDFDYGYREFCPLDSLIQWIGRLNRNGRGIVGVGEVCFIDTGRFYSVYNDVLLDITKRILSRFNEIKEKEYFYIIKEYYDQVKKNIGEMEKVLTEAIEKFKFEDGIYLFKIFDNEGEKISIFINHDDKSQEILDKYLEYTTTHYPNITQRKATWYRIRKEVSNHIVSVKKKFAADVDDKQLLEEHYWSYLNLPSNNYSLEYGFEEE